jgi:hypothetical protein
MQGPHRLEIVALATDRLGPRLWHGLQPGAHLSAPENLRRHSPRVPDLAPGRCLSDPDRRAVLDAPPEASAHPPARARPRHVRSHGPRDRAAPSLEDGAIRFF